MKGLEFSKKYFQVKKTFFNIALKKIFGIIYETQKKKKLKLFEKTKNKLLEELEESKIFSQTYILYDISGILKQTFVSELEKFTNTYSQFTIFWKKKKNIKISEVLPSTTKYFFPVKKWLQRWKRFIATAKETERITDQTFF